MTAPVVWGTVEVLAHCGGRPHTPGTRNLLRQWRERNGFPKPAGTINGGNNPYWAPRDVRRWWEQRTQAPTSA